MWHYGIVKDKNGYSIREFVKVNGKWLYTDALDGYWETKEELLQSLERKLQDCKRYNVKKIDG